MSTEVVSQPDSQEEFGKLALHLHGRDSGNNFGRFSVPFLEGRVSDIRAACIYPTRNANFKSRISDI